MFIQKLGLEVNRRDLPRMLLVKDVPFLVPLSNHFVFGFQLSSSGNHRTNPCLFLSFRRVKMASRAMVSSILTELFAHKLRSAVSSN